jgi:hypothetical protein
MNIKINKLNSVPYMKSEYFDCTNSDINIVLSKASDIDYELEFDDIQVRIEWDSEYTCLSFYSDTTKKMYTLKIGSSKIIHSDSLPIANSYVNNFYNKVHSKQVVFRPLLQQ